MRLNIELYSSHHPIFSHKLYQIYVFFYLLRHLSRCEERPEAIQSADPGAHRGGGLPGGAGQHDHQVLVGGPLRTARLPLPQDHYQED